jgi:xylulokinase
VAPDGRLVATDAAPTGLRLLPGGGAEEDPDEWWDATATACRRMMAAADVDPDDVTAVSCTGQWSGTVAVDAAGRALAPAITWMDHRGAGHVARITAGFPRVAGYGIRRLQRWIRLTGGAPGKAGKDPIAHILYLEHARPDVYAAAHRFLEPKDFLNLRLTGGAPGKAGKDPIAHILYLEHARPDVYAAAHRFLEPKDFLNLRLTGRFAATNDSIALHWVTDNRDPDRVRYDPTLLGYAGIDPSKLPEIVPATSVLGPVLPEAAAALGIGEGAVVVGGTPDVQSAGIGSGAVADFAGHLYVGTSSWISCHVPFKKTDLVHNMASLPSPLPGRYFLANEQETAGACLRYLADNVLYGDDELGGPAPDDVYRRFDRVAATVPPGAGGVVFTPWLYGERTPVEDPWVRGGFFNQSLETTRADLVRAVFEGVALNARWLLGSVERFVGRRLDPLVMIGGGASSAVWCRIFADVLDRTIVQAEDPISANLRGAAILARLALGEIDVPDASAMVPLAATFVPDAATRRVYDERFRSFRDLYRATRKVYARMNRGSGP